MCERTFQNACQLLDSLTDAGVDAVYNAADMADNRGPFFSPPQMERFIWPYMERWNQRVRQKGLFSILHTDGNVEKLLPLSLIHISPLTANSWRTFCRWTAAPCPANWARCATRACFASKKTALLCCKPGAWVSWVQWFLLRNYGTKKCVLYRKKRRPYNGLRRQEAAA